MRDGNTCQYCGARAAARRAEPGPRRSARPGRPHHLGERRLLLHRLQPVEGRPHAGPGGAEAAEAAAAPALDADLPHQRRPGPLPRVAAVPRPRRRVLLERRARRLVVRRERERPRRRTTRPSPKTTVRRPGAERRPSSRRRDHRRRRPTCAPRAKLIALRLRARRHAAARCWRPTSPSTWRRRRRRWSRIDADPAGGPLHQLLGRARARRAASASSCAARRTGLGELIVDTPIAGVGLMAGEGSAFGAARPKQTAKVTLAAIARARRRLRRDRPRPGRFDADAGPVAGAPTSRCWSRSPIRRRSRRPTASPRARSSGGCAPCAASIAWSPNAAGPPPAALDLYRSIARGGRPGRAAGAGDPPLPADVHRQPDAHPAGPQARRLHGDGGAAAARAHVRVSGSRRVRRDGLAGGAAAAVAGRRVSRGEGVEEHRAAGAAPAVAGQRARARTPGRRRPLRLEEEQTYYEILETEPGVSDEEVRRAYRTIKDNYACGLAGDRGPLRGARAGGAARAGQRRARHAVRARSAAAVRPGAARGGSGARGARGGQRQAGVPPRRVGAAPRSAPRPPRPRSTPTPR